MFNVCILMTDSDYSDRQNRSHDLTLIKIYKDLFQTTIAPASSSSASPCLGGQAS